MRGCHSAYDGICQETGGRGMKALFLVAIISNFISIVSNLSITAFNGTMDEYMELMNP